MKAHVEGIVDIVWYLALNDVRNGPDSITPFGPFQQEKEALDFYQSCLTTPYTEEGYTKFFLKNSKMEYMVPLTPEELKYPNNKGHGLVVEWGKLRDATILQELE